MKDFPEDIVIECWETVATYFGPNFCTKIHKMGVCRKTSFFMILISRAVLWSY